MEEVNKYVTKFWIRSFLKRLGRKTPEFLLNLINELPVSNKTKLVMKLRYIDNLQWCQIEDAKGVYLSEVRIKQLEKECIDKIEFLVF